ncbi:hypothetical protein H9X57_18180 [Flavobacterium piscinae]|jgi:hypothetical protein|nr:hypothetical protein [Flavobacterium piscinae]MBC8884603.1 hypothetical protein [Flavobacterium piscinae]
MILDRAIKGEEHILTIILSNSLKGSYIYIAGESLDYKTYTSYYKGKLIKCELKKCHILKVNNKQAIDLTINNEKIVVCSGQSYLYKYLIVEKGRKNGIILKYTNILKY